MLDIAGVVLLSSSENKITPPLNISARLLAKVCAPLLYIEVPNLEVLALMPVSFDGKPISSRYWLSALNLFFAIINFSDSLCFLLPLGFLLGVTFQIFSSGEGTPYALRMLPNILSFMSCERMPIPLLSRMKSLNSSECCTSCISLSIASIGALPTTRSIASESSISNISSAPSVFSSD